MADLCVALFVEHPFPQLNHRVTNFLLQVSVVGLGFGMDVSSLLRAGKEGVLFTVVSIAGTLGAGLVMGRMMKTDKMTSLLIAGGTAICGGSAIESCDNRWGKGWTDIDAFFDRERVVASGTETDGYKTDDAGRDTLDTDRGSGALGGDSVCHLEVLQEFIRGKDCQFGKRDI